MFQDKRIERLEKRIEELEAQLKMYGLPRRRNTRLTGYRLTIGEAVVLLARHLNVEFSGTYPQPARWNIEEKRKSSGI